jgi:hypothetical protein
MTTMWVLEDTSNNCQAVEIYTIGNDTNYVITLRNVIINKYFLLVSVIIWRYFMESGCHKFFPESYNFLYLTNTHKLWCWLDLSL